MAGEPNGMRTAVLGLDGFETMEMTEAQAALDAAGTATGLTSPRNGTVKPGAITGWGSSFPLDLPLDSVEDNDIDGLRLPGDAMNLDQLRADAEDVHSTRRLFQAGKSLSAISHAPWTLVKADVLSGHIVTSWLSLQAKLQNVGATWVSEAVVVGGKLVTSRLPTNMTDFASALIPHFVADAVSAFHNTRTEHEHA